MRTSDARSRARESPPSTCCAIRSRSRSSVSISRAAQAALHCQNRRKNERRSCAASQPFKPCRGWLASSRPSPRAAQKRTARARTCVRALGPTLALSPSLAPPSLYASRRVVLGLDWPWPGSAPLVDAAVMLDVVCRLYGLPSGPAPGMVRALGERMHIQLVQRRETMRANVDNFLLLRRACGRSRRAHRACAASI